MVDIIKQQNVEGFPRDYVNLIVSYMQDAISLKLLFLFCLISTVNMLSLFCLNWFVCLASIFGITTKLLKRL